MASNARRFSRNSIRFAARSGFARASGIPTTIAARRVSKGAPKIGLRAVEETSPLALTSLDRGASSTDPVKDTVGHAGQLSGRRALSPNHVALVSADCPSDIRCAAIELARRIGPGHPHPRAPPLQLVDDDGPQYRALRAGHLHRGLHLFPLLGQATLDTGFHLRQRAVGFGQRLAHTAGDIGDLTERGSTGLERGDPPRNPDAVLADLRLRRGHPPRLVAQVRVALVDVGGVQGRIDVTHDLAAARGNALRRVDVVFFWEDRSSRHRRRAAPPGAANR